MSLLRTLSAFIAVASLGGVAVQAYAWSIDTTYASGGLGPALWAMYAYFTIITNTVVGIAAGAIAWRGTSSWWIRPQRVGALIPAILIVGIVYHLLLAHLWDPHGLVKLADVLHHTVVPIACVVWWIAVLPTSGLAWRDVISWLAYPMAYLAYCFVRGAFTKQYPYPFLDVGTLGWAATLVNVVGLTVVFLVFGVATIAVARRRASALTDPGLAS